MTRQTPIAQRRRGDSHSWTDSSMVDRLFISYEDDSFTV